MARTNGSRIQALLATHNFIHNSGEIIAMSVSFTDDMICVLLTDGREVKTPKKYYPRLAGATNEQLNNSRFLGDGRGIHCEKLNEDWSVESIVLGRRAINEHVLTLHHFRYIHLSHVPRKYPICRRSRI